MQIEGDVGPFVDTCAYKPSSAFPENDAVVVKTDPTYAATISRCTHNKFTGRNVAIKFPETKKGADNKSKLTIA